MHNLEPQTQSRTIKSEPIWKDPIPSPGFNYPQRATWIFDSGATDCPWPSTPAPLTELLGLDYILSFLVRCYLRQIYGSDQVRTALMDEAATMGIDDSLCPTAAEISAFRNIHRRLIRNGLVEALLRLAAQKLASGFVTHFNAKDVAAEASRRMIMAVFIDHLETGCCEGQPVLEK